MSTENRRLKGTCSSYFQIPGFYEGEMKPLQRESGWQNNEEGEDRMETDLCSPWGNEKRITETDLTSPWAKYFNSVMANNGGDLSMRFVV